ncbi:hypothetical protein WAI453_000960 [Rhynchosporium graminicola]|uniref:chitinase n=1 Tax=Rhynchosporium graminicola TaxID=2792576 RepID=A0A1E1K5L2_9HELO|nr:related to CRH1-family of putative glycosidases might exert a common role in cell wall organization [Rhynchosporium commune]
MFSKSIFAVAATICELATAQTFSSCNPLYTTGCPANTALGKSINVDFTKGSVNSFTASGNPTYDSSGVHFTVAGPGAAPQLASVFYIMFGKVQITMKSAPGAGVVSTLVLQSDTLDEIDMEWLGADDTEVQTNYFGKGDITTYNRGAFNPAPNNQGEFITYTIDWTSEQIKWYVGNKLVRVLTPATADKNQYPQSPMQIKFGSWSGGDSSNPSGTISWARGPTDYSKGPFTMTVQSIAVTDYSTGTQYKYGDTSGNWGSIQAVGGKVNGNSGAAAAPVAIADAPAITSASPSIPAGLGDNHGSTAHQTGWPWVATTTLATITPVPTVAGLPSGWIITSEGKIQPASSAAIPLSTPFPSAGLSPLPLFPPLGGGLDVSTGFDDRGFPTTYTRQYGWATMSKSYDDRGFLITAGPTRTVAGQAEQTQAACFGPNCGNAGKAMSASNSKAVGAQKNPAWQYFAVLGALVVMIQSLLL